MVALLSIDHRTLIKSSFDQLVPVSNTFFFLFYNRLFETHPDLKPLFAASIDEQGPKLMVMLTILVRGMDHLPELTPKIEEMALRHVKYGVKAEDYQSLGEALIWAIGEMLGDAFTPEAQAAWQQMYNIVAEICCQAAYK